MTAKTFFSDEEKARIEAAVNAAEARTSGEIVPLLVDAAYDYPRAEIVGGASFALGLAVLVAWAFGHDSIWVFLPVFLVAYLPCKLLIRTLPGLKRRMIHPAEMAAEVEEKALVSFLTHNLHQTRDATGVLILICLFEKRVRVLADSGISSVIPQPTWDEIVATITATRSIADRDIAIRLAAERSGRSRRAAGDHRRSPR